MEFDQPNSNALSQELERIRSYVNTIQRSINETRLVSQALKEDLETARDQRQTHDEALDYDHMLEQCLTKSADIQYVDRVDRIVSID